MSFFTTKCFILDCFHIPCMAVHHCVSGCNNGSLPNDRRLKKTTPKLGPLSVNWTAKICLNSLFSNTAAKSVLVWCSKVYWCYGKYSLQTFRWITWSKTDYSFILDKRLPLLLFLTPNIWENEKKDFSPDSLGGFFVAIYQMRELFLTCMIVQKLSELHTNSLSVC